MSALTKVFVVLHVILTMLFVSAAVVYVNRVEDFQGRVKQKDAELAIAARQAQFAQSQADTAVAEATAVKIQTAAEVTRVRDQNTQLQSQIRDLGTQIAQLRASVGSAEASLQGANAALATAQESNKLLSTQMNETRAASDKIQEENTQLQTAIADAQARWQTARRALEQANEEIEELRGAIADNADRPGPGPAAARASAGEEPGITPATPIIGELRDKRNVNGVTYATISVGASDQVTKNMVFNVIDRERGDFLGYLRVDRVEPNEAIGRLDGPRIADVKPGNEVRTQL